MNSNHSIDVEAERKLFESAAREEMHYDHTYFECCQSGNYVWREVQVAWQIWLAAKRSIPANTGTIDTPEFMELALRWACMDSDILDEVGQSEELAAWSALIAHIDARLNAATMETPCKKN